MIEKTIKGNILEAVAYFGEDGEPSEPKDAVRVIITGYNRLTNQRLYSTHATLGKAVKQKKKPLTPEQLARNMVRG